ncbi:class I SAM-dependent methyltransferase [Oceanisphaera avium]|uniref:Methyltransferase n=1 Tax=Oceanisphaera avium TaxID=1903694 RepID=A0A1Y0CWH7_9GAMM|nr:methyltransferase domain-containing protein [Oceanisphaera avium]ART79691.1 methyltransferase [Oceanisphaera avium]
MKSVSYAKTWQQLLRGPYLAQLIQARLDHWAPSLFGFNLLSVEALSASLTLKGSRLLHRVNLCEQASTEADIVGQATAMPFAPGSLDACLLAHVLDYSAHPHAVLREVETVLRDDGWLIICGYNPYSSAGLACFVPGLSHKLPKWRAMIAPERVEDWLKLLGFEVLERDYFGLTPLAEGVGFKSVRQFLVPRYCPSFAGAYVMLARKRRHPLTPIRQPQRRPLLLQPGMACQQQQLTRRAKPQTYSKK